MAFPVEASFIDAAEKELDFAFPSRLREHLVNCNGGTLFAKSHRAPMGDDWTLHSVMDDSSRARLKRSVVSNVVTETVSAREWPRFRSDAVAIASNGMGDLLILKNGSSKVWNWDHETGDTCEASVEWTKL